MLLMTAKLLFGREKIITQPLELERLRFVLGYEAECMSRDRLQQLHKTSKADSREVLKPHYRRMLQSIGLEADVKELTVLSALPFLKDFQDTYPLACCSAANEIVRYHSSSGTTGKPIVVLTRHIWLWPGLN